MSPGAVRQNLGSAVCQVLFAKSTITRQNGSRRFFALPLDKKATCKRSADNAWGFFNDELTKQKLDLKEGFDVGHPPRPDLPDDAPENR